MLKIAPALIGLALFFVSTTTVRAAPPHVVKTTPENGAKDVSPNTKQIVVVFDQPMSRSGRSIVGGGDSFPELGQITWSDPKTLVISVKLKPDHDYWLSINSETFTNFRNAKNEPCVAYPIAFSTASPESAKLDPAMNKKSIDQLRKAIDNDYSYRDLRKVDWNKLFKDGTPKLEAAPTASAFAEAAGERLAPANDVHMWLKVGDRTIATTKRDVPANVNVRTLERLVPQWQRNKPGIIATGEFDDGIMYLLIAGWQSDPKLYEDAFDVIESLDANKGLIIDVRANAGGDESRARDLAGCFVKEPVVYSKHTIRKNGRWIGPQDRTLEPTKGRPSISASKVVVLQGRYCMSSNESFLLMMKSAGATLVGETTFGSSGNPQPHELDNGVTIYLPSWKDMLPDGSTLEGVGVKPQVEVKAQPKDFDDADPVLDAALSRLRGGAK